jgi:hypothetical protein
MNMAQERSCGSSLGFPDPNRSVLSPGPHINGLLCMFSIKHLYPLVYAYCMLNVYVIGVPKNLTYRSILVGGLEHLDYFP